MKKTWFNDLLGKMFTLLIPLILINSLNVLTYIINSIWVGRLIGETGVATIINCYSITIMLTAIIVGIASAVSVLIAQSYGVGNEKGINEVINFGYLISVIVGIVTFAIVIFFSPLFMNILGTPESIYADVRIYLSLYSFAFIFNLLLNVMSESVRALGDTKTPLLFVGIETVINIILVPIFILGGFGIAGVGCANVLAKIFTCIIVRIIIYKKYPVLRLDLENFNFRFDVLKKIIYVSVPIMVEQLIIAAVISLETGISNRAGVLGSAAYGVVAKWEQVFLVLSQSLQSLITIMIGQNITKKSMENVYRIVICGIVLAVLPMTVIAIISYVKPEFFCKLFINSDDVITASMEYLSIVGIAYILMPMRLIFNGFIIGTAHTRYLLFSSTTASVGEVIVMYILKNRSSLESMTILGLSVLTYVLLDIFFCFLFFVRGSWKKNFDV